jgi:hypothetical protein
MCSYDQPQETSEMQLIRIIFDYDGTLALREHPLDAQMAKLLVEVLHRGWHLAVLTGRNIQYVEQHFVAPLLDVPCMNVLRLAPQIRLFTCEGASSWRISQSATVERDPSFPNSKRFSQDERRRLESNLDRHLSATLAQSSLSLAHGPEWWENSLLIFKVSGDVSNRAVVAGRLQSLLASDEPLRVGVAGKTTIVIARKGLCKSWLLCELLATEWSADCNVFVADEFVPPGNDSCVAEIDGIIKVGVDAEPSRLPVSVLPARGSGPEATKRWLGRVLNTNASHFRTAKELIEHAAG